MTDDELREILTNMHRIQACMERLTEAASAIWRVSRWPMAAKTGTLSRCR
jgi:hypothetical protein